MSLEVSKYYGEKFFQRTTLLADGGKQFVEEEYLPEDPTRRLDGAFSPRSLRKLSLRTDVQRFRDIDSEVVVD